MENALRFSERLAISAMLGEYLSQTDLTRLLESIVVLDRDTSGSGFITRFQPVSSGLEPRGSSWNLDLVVDHPELVNGAVFTLFVQADGSLDSLEGAAFSDQPWPTGDSDLLFRQARS